MTTTPHPQGPAEPAQAQRLPDDPALYARKTGAGLRPWAVGLLCLLAAGVGAGAMRLVDTRSDTAVQAPAPVQSLAVAPPAAPDADGGLDRDPGLEPSPYALGEPSSYADVSALAERLERLESAQRRTLDAAAGALAAASLSEAASGSAPFEAALGALEPVLPDTPDLRALRRLSQTGAPTRPALAAEFSALAARAAAAARAPEPGAGLFSGLARSLAAVVSIRRVDQTTGEGADAVLARTERLLAGGEVEEAVRHSERLPPAARDVLAAWRARAESRVEIDRRVAAVRAAALSGLSAEDARRQGGLAL